MPNNGFDAWLLKVQTDFPRGMEVHDTANDLTGRVVAYVTMKHGTYLELMDCTNGITWRASVDFAEPARTLSGRVAEAAARGKAAGEARRAEVLAFRDRNGTHGKADDELPEWSPLSGEWAGESIPELLGDLLDEDADDVCEIEDAYETAALAAYYGEED